MLRNEAYLGRRIWNREDNTTAGRKYKPREHGDDDDYDEQLDQRQTPHVRSLAVRAHQTDARATPSMAPRQLIRWWPTHPPIAEAHHNRNSLLTSGERPAPRAKQSGPHPNKGYEPHHIARAD